MKKLLSTLLGLLIFSGVCFAQNLPPVNVEEEDGSPSVFVYKIKVANGNLTDNADGTCSVADQTGAGGGDPILVDTVAIADANGVDLTSGTGVNITLNAGLSPDTATFTTNDSAINHDALNNFVGNEHIDHTGVTLTAGVGLTGGGDISANRTFTFAPSEVAGDQTWSDGTTGDWTWNVGTTDPVIQFRDNLINVSVGAFQVGGSAVLTSESDPNALLTAGTDNVKDTHIDWGSGASQVDLADIPGGAAGANAFDFGGATSVEVPNTAGDVTCDATGEVAIDSTQKQFAWYDGSREVAIPSDHKATVIITAGDWDLDSDKWVHELDSTRYPDGIVITKWTVDANVADPAVELNANLMYCDALSAGAFPGANPTLIDVLDTTTGNSSESTMSNSDLGSGTIPAGKIIYIDIDVDPATATDFFVVQIYFYQPES